MSTEMETFRPFFGEPVQAKADAMHARIKKMLFDFDIIMRLEMHYKTVPQSVLNKKNLYCIPFQYRGQIHFRHTSKDFPDAKRLREIGQKRNRF